MMAILFRWEATMAFDWLKSDLTKGVALGIAAAVVTPIVLPAAVAAARPLARAALRNGLLLYEKGRETVAEAGEMLDDLLAEVRAELSQQAAAGAADRDAAPAAGAEPTPPPS
jgi:hypothetical protein